MRSHALHVVSIDTPKGRPLFVEGWVSVWGCCKQRYRWRRRTELIGREVAAG